MKKLLISIVFMLAIVSSMFSFSAFAAQMADGTYEVNIALWHSEDDKESMASDAVGTKATIVVENGVKTMHITSGEMSMMGIKASLQELKIADANGNYVDAKVESKDSEGNPTGFYFTMPHTNEYITVKVNPHIAIMGNKDIGARIKVDYSTLKLVKPAETAAETTVAQTANSSVETVTDIVTESEIVKVSENISPETTAENTPEETEVFTQTNLQNAMPSQSHAVIIIIAAIAAAAIIFTAVKVKRKK